MRKAGEAVVRLLLFGAAAALLRWAVATHHSWADEFASSFRQEWGPWFGWVSLLVAAGFLVGLASATGRPGGYRLLVPLTTALPALLLLGHYVLMIEDAQSGGDGLPGILNGFYFYMDVPAQFALSVIAGFGIAAGLRPRAEPQS